MSAEPLDGEGLISRKLRLKDADVVWLRGVLDAYEGLAGLYGDGSGVIVLSTPVSRAQELDSFLEDIRGEIEFQLEP